jgi:hypothetical protein
MGQTHEDQIKAAESLIDSASELIMDAVGLLMDVGETETIRRLEELAVAVSREGTRLKIQRGATDEVAAVIETIAGRPPDVAVRR